MSSFQATGVLIILFALRCIVPILIVVGIGYLMNRLVDRWEAEAAVAEAASVEPQAVHPATAVADTAPAPAIPALPCWITRNCDETRRKSCPAFHQPDLPCWQARAAAEGAQPADCPSCPVYEGARLAF